MNFRRLRIGVCLAIIFLAGGVTGAVISVRFIQHKSAEQPRSAEWTERAMKKLSTELDLSPEQAERIRPIVAVSCEEAADIHRRSRLEVARAISNIYDAIEPELDPGQRDRLEQMQLRHRERWRSWRNQESTVDETGSDR